MWSWAPRTTYLSIIFFLYHSIISQHWTDWVAAMVSLFFFSWNIPVSESKVPSWRQIFDMCRGALFISLQYICSVVNCCETCHGGEYSWVQLQGSEFRSLTHPILVPAVIAAIQSNANLLIGVVRLVVLENTQMHLIMCRLQQKMGGPSSLTQTTYDTEEA